VLSEHRSSGATNISRPTSTFNANSRKFLEQFISPLALREAQVKRAYLFIYNENRTKVHNVLLLFKNIFSDFCQTNYLNIYRADLHEICRIGRTLAVDERVDLKLFISISQGTTNFCVQNRPTIHTF